MVATGTHAQKVQTQPVCLSNPITILSAGFSWSMPTACALLPDSGEIPFGRIVKVNTTGT
jgi:hypothetical protein